MNAFQRARKIRCMLVSCPYRALKVALSSTIYMILLKMLQAVACNFTKSNTPLWIYVALIWFCYWSCEANLPIGQNNAHWKYQWWPVTWFPVGFCFLQRNYFHETKISVHLIDICSKPYFAYFLNSIQISFPVAVWRVQLMLHKFVPALACFIIFTSLTFDRRW